MRRLSDDVGERARVSAAVGALKAAQLDAVAVDSDAVVTGRHQLAAVLAPRQ